MGLICPQVRVVQKHIVSLGDLKALEAKLPVVIRDRPLHRPTECLFLGQFPSLLVMQQLNQVMELCGAGEGTLGKISNVL